MTLLVQTHFILDKALPVLTFTLEYDHSPRNCATNKTVTFFYRGRMYAYLYCSHLYIALNLTCYLELKNMKRITLLIILMCAAVLTGCGPVMQVKNTVLNPTDYDVSVVKHELHYQNENINNGSLYVVWSSFTEQLAQSFSGIYINIDGKRAGAIKWESYTVLNLKPGSYKLSVGGEGDNDTEVEVTIVANQDVYYRAGIENNYLLPDVLTLKKEDNAAAKDLVKKLTYVTLK
jgi:hypothetical protein